jgi:hypothetical protein
MDRAGGTETGYWTALVEVAWQDCVSDAVAASLRKQGVSVNAIVQQNQEFTIQNEDFPALPGFRGGSNELTSDSEHHKDQQHENALAANMPQHFMVYHPFQMLFEPDITCLMGGAWFYYIGQENASFFGKGDACL